MLDAIAGGLRELPSVDLKELPRMADFAEWGEATSRGLGWGTETFLSTYNDNRKEATEMLLDDSPVATVLLALARKGINWSGTPLKLYRDDHENCRQEITSGPAGPRRSARSATNCAASLPSFACTDFHQLRTETRRTHHHPEIRRRHDEGFINQHTTFMRKLRL